MALVVPTPSRTREWRISASKLKRYPHFDDELNVKQAISLATDPIRVKRHSFYPFLVYDKRWNRYADRGEKGKPKSRLIRYAARADAYIFSYYRHILSELYEEEIFKQKLSNSILAYRKIHDEIDNCGKCNIHFARDAIARIKQFGNCWVVALDITQFFESLDHSILKSIWARLLNCSRLPDDHYQVFKHITRYATIEKMKVYERLGHFGPKRLNYRGEMIPGYLTPYKEIPKKTLHRPRVSAEDGGRRWKEEYYRCQS